MIERGPRQGQVTRYSYNARNQLVQVNVNGAVTRYAYDALCRRISKTTGHDAEQASTTQSSNISKTTGTTPELCADQYQSNLRKNKNT